MRLYGRDYEVLSIGSTGNGLYEGFNYDVEFSLHDSRIKDGTNCIDYLKIGSSFGKCFENNMKVFMLEKFGCLFPWFPEVSGNSTCKEIRKHNDNDLMQSILDVGNFVLGLKTHLIEPCKPSCLTMSIKLKKLDQWTGNDAAILQFNILDEVIVHTDTSAYDMFNLVVDLGSALGLWLGLSAVSIFDFIVETCFARNA